MDRLSRQKNISGYYFKSKPDGTISLSLDLRAYSYSVTKLFLMNTAIDFYITHYGMKSLSLLDHVNPLTDVIYSSFFTNTDYC